MNHQYSGTYKLHQLTSNPGLLIPKSVLLVNISWGDLIIIPLIMVMLRFTLQSFQPNITLNLFHIQTPLLSNQLMMMKWTIYCNSFTQKMMKIFWMLTSRWFRLDWWSPFHQLFLQYLLCCLINMEERIFQSQILCHAFLYFTNQVHCETGWWKSRSRFYMFIPTKATVKLDNGNMWHAQVIGIILCCFTNYYIIYPVGPV